MRESDGGSRHEHHTATHRAVRHVERGGARMRALRSDGRKTAMSGSRPRMTGRYPARCAHVRAAPGGASAIRRSRLMRAAVAGLIVFAAACSTAGAQGTRAECEAAGGKWGRFGLRQQELCDLPAPDAGKACTDSKDCASACVAPDAAPVASSAEEVLRPHAAARHLPQAGARRRGGASAVR